MAIPGPKNDRRAWSNYQKPNQGQKRKRGFEKTRDAVNNIVFRDDVAADSTSKANGGRGGPIQQQSKKQQKGQRNCYHKPMQNGIRSQAPGKPEAPAIPEKRKRILETRAQLPISSRATDVRLSLRDLRDVLIMVGETGSGKSTQMPQFLMTEPWCTGQVAITQPRRVAAISLAKRVAEEMGTTLGNASPASKVGYSVRFDQSVAPACRVKFLTEGMLLQELLRDPWLRDYSVVVVDEVHERSVNVDLVLGFLRRILIGQGRDEKKARKGKGRLKVVIMSATADTEKLYRFFEDGFSEAEARRVERQGAEKGQTNEHAASQWKQGPEGQVNGAADQHLRSELDHGETQKDENDAGSEASWSGFSSSDEDEAGTGHRMENESNDPSPPSPGALERHHRAMTEAEFENTVHIPSDYISTMHITGRQHMVETLYAPSATNDVLEAALQTIFQIHYKEPLPGDVLVFLTGQDTVEALQRLVDEHASAMASDIPRLQALPLFAALPQALQARIFDPTPKNTRKVILATNIAETSLTIPGIVHVVDTGLAKIKEHRPSAGFTLSSLLVKPISKSSALQRKGRAGRERPGKCWRLYPEREYLKLDETTKPEILRSDVASAVLVMKARGVNDVLDFPLLDRPPDDQIRAALLQLLRLGALEEDGKISQDGKKMARLPLPPNMARVLVSAGQSVVSGEGEEDSIITEVVDIIAALSAEALFLPLNSEESVEEAAVSRRELLRREGDHLTLLCTVRAYATEQTDRKAWCEKRFVSHRAMKNVMDIRKQLLGQCAQQGLLPKHLANQSSAEVEAGISPLTPEKAERILRCFLQGFSTNVARLMPDRTYKTLEGNGTVTIHPSSVLFGRKVEAVLYNELVFTNKAYMRGCSVIEMGWWGEVVGAMA